jgi:SAM-dependent methyltransferase
MPAAKAVRLLCRRFPWLRTRRQELGEWIAWQEAVHSRPNFYFRWHLPRLAMTIEVLARALAGLHQPRVLDLGCYAPYAILMEQHLRRIGTNAPRWTRSGVDGLAKSFEVASTVQRVERVALDLSRPPVPFENASFDVVLLAEVIEHIDRHPQVLLSEINRILAPGGRLVLTTPNVTSWKKMLRLTDGNWSYDTATFGKRVPSGGHRYEYSFYQMREVMRRAGFEVRSGLTRDVYLDDPHGPSQAIQFLALASAKVATGRVKSAARMFLRRGSVLFLTGYKVSETPAVDWLPI